MGFNPLFLVFPVVSLLLSLAALVIGFTAPYGRRALTAVGGGLLLVGSGLTLVLILGGGSIHEAVSALNGGRTASIVLDVLGGLSDFLWATGLLLVAVAATKRRPRPRAVPAPHAPYGVPQGAHQAGPHQGGPHQAGPQGAPAPHAGPRTGPPQGGPQGPGPRPGGPGQDGPRPPHTPR
ncbi:hypothetical protein ABZ249_04690 [Nocardiopsis sp. NPDC006139]|uniref:hypothetical protein n=1 Tax=Nocardiopsis sp. NPDC006139 TaxID=3154578 RepID=UPI0033BDAB87